MFRFKWSISSQEKLSQAHTILQHLADKALEISGQDLKVICGYRGEAEQNKAFQEGTSKLKWPASAHNMHPSRAIDVVPLPGGKIDWNNIDAFNDMVQTFKRAWDMLDEDITRGYVLVCGADFKSFSDKPHFEIKRIKNETR